MALVSSLFTAISGMRNHQTMLDVISNNVANVNTVGYKAGRVVFRDLLSQTIMGASSANPLSNTGGVNAIQMGMGASVASIDTIQTQGSMQATGIVTDLALNGDGYFITQAGGQTLYTRAGNFNFDSAGQMVDASGGVVQGWVAQQSTNTRAFVGIDANGRPVYSSPNPLTNLVVDSTNPANITSIRIDSNVAMQAQETKNITLQANLDAGATAANLVNSAGINGSVTQLQVYDGGIVASATPPALHTYTVGTTTINLPIVDSLGNTHNLAMTLTNLSGTIIPGSQPYDATAVPPTPASVYQNNTWAWTINCDPADTSTRLALDNTTFFDPGSYNPADQSSSLVRASSSGLVNFNPNGSLNWVAYGDRNAEHFGSNVTNGLLITQATNNDPTIPGGWQYGIGNTWTGSADGDIWNGSIIGFEGAAVPAGDEAADTSQPIGSINNPVPVPPLTGLWDSPAPMDLKKCQVVLVYQNVPPSATGTVNPVGPTGTSAGQRVFSNTQALPGTLRQGLNIGGETTNLTEDWYTQWMDIDWGTVSTITAADFDRVNMAKMAPAVPPAGLLPAPDVLQTIGTEDGVMDGAESGDKVEGHDFPWDPYVRSNLDGGRDGLTQDVAGTWQLYNGVMAYVPNFSSPVIGQDGYQRGVLQSLQIGSDGTIVGGYTNGNTLNLAQVAVASFSNPAGLVKQGDTHFVPSTNSGNVVVGRAQDGGRGTIVSGVLEQSNVDLTSELTNMIVAQRGFEVNARMVSTSDRILDTLVNMGR